MKAATITGVFAGSYLSFGTVPAAIYFIGIEGEFWPLIPATATLSSAVIGYRTLAGRRYHAKKWKLAAIMSLN